MVGLVMEDKATEFSCIYSTQEVVVEVVIHPSPLSLPPRHPPEEQLSRDNSSSNLRRSSSRWRRPTDQRRCSILSAAWMGCSSPFTATSILSRRLSVLPDRWLKIVSLLARYNIIGVPVFSITMS